MDELMQLFVEEMVDKLKRSIMFDEETKVINDLRNDLQNTNENDFITSLKCNAEEAVRTYSIVASVNHLAPMPIFFLYNKLDFIDSKSFGGYDITNNFIWISMFKSVYAKENTFDFLKRASIQIFNHPNILASLHHEVAHFNFKNSFPTEEDYMNFRNEDYKDKSQSKEEYNSFLQEFLSYIESEKLYLDTKEDIEKFFKDRASNLHIHNLYLNLKQFKNQEEVMEDLLVLAGNYKLEEEYGIKQKGPEELRELRKSKDHVLTGEAKKRADARLKELFTTGIKHYIYMEDLPRIRAEYEELKKLNDEMKKHK